MRERPSQLPAGAPLGDHYAIVGLVGVAERRMYYLANDVRPDQARRFCWKCAHPDTQRSAAACERCQARFGKPRFLVSARWGPLSGLRAWLAFCEQHLVHPGLATPIDAFLHDGVLYSIIRYRDEGLLLGDASPTSNRHLLEHALRIVGTLAFLRSHGVRVAWLQRANLLLSGHQDVRLFDLELAEPQTDESPVDGSSTALRSLGDLLRRSCDPEAVALMDLFCDAEDGAVKDLPALGRAIEAGFRAFAHVTYAGRVGGVSDLGLKRQLNEDNFGWMRLSARACLYVVADGMGGHDGGEVASALAVRTVCEVARRHEAATPEGDEAVEEMLRDAFQAANNGIKDAADQRGTDMGTTLVGVLLIEGGVGFIANVGDSRGYLVRRGALGQVTKDHSLVQKMVDRGRITPEEARHHPHSNILLRTVGTERDIEIDVFRVELEPGDRVLLCSDGLWGEVDDPEIESILRACRDPRAACRELVRAAHHHGAKDNVTIVIVDLPEAGDDVVP